MGNRKQKWSGNNIRYTWLAATQDWLIAKVPIAAAANIARAFSKSLFGR